jgi:hypothetical protein
LTQLDGKAPKPNVRLLAAYFGGIDNEYAGRFKRLRHNSRQHFEGTEIPHQVAVVAAQMREFPWHRIHEVPDRATLEFR